MSKSSAPRGGRDGRPQILSFSLEGEGEGPPNFPLMYPKSLNLKPTIKEY